MSSRFGLATLLLVCIASPVFGKPPKKHRQSNGIFVGVPKLYDDRALQGLFATTIARLGQLNSFDQTSLLSHLGAVQGASVSQTQFGVQANGLPIPAVTSTINSAAPNTVTTVDNTSSQKAGAAGPDIGSETKNVTTGATASTQSQMQSQQVAPTTAALSSPATFSLPTNFSVSALNLLNEQMQLSADIINLQMLLQGALSDQIGKVQKTLGFSISISVPPEYRYRHSVAEVDVSVCNPVGVTSLRTPSLVMLLPREKTYNVASLVSKSASLGSGVVAGVVNVGGSFLGGHQTYYLAQDQDTVAIQTAPDPDDTCEVQQYGADKRTVTTLRKYAPVSFAWQFRPVLGRTAVQDGMRQTFAEFAFPHGIEAACSARLKIKTGWRMYDAKTARVGEWVDQPEVYTVFAPNVTSSPGTISVSDNGDGTLTAVVEGQFPAGTRVRVGNVTEDDSSQGFERTPSYIKFTAPALALAMQNAVLVARDGTETEVVPTDQSELPSCDQPLPPPVPDHTAEPAVGGASSNTQSGGQWHRVELIRVVGPSSVEGQAGVRRGLHRQNVTSVPQRGATRVSGEPEQSLVQQQAEEASGRKETQFVQVTPVSDTASLVTIRFEPPLSDPRPEPDTPVAIIGARVFGLRDAPFLERDGDHAVFAVPNDVLKANQQITWKQLFSDSDTRIFWIPKSANFAITSVALLATANDENTYSLTGTGLDQLQIVLPRVKNVQRYGNGTMVLFDVGREDASGTKNLVVQNGSGTPVLVALPSGAPPEFKLDEHSAISVGDTSLKLTGTLLEKIVEVRFLKKPLVMTLSSDKKNVVVQLPPEFTAVPGIQRLKVILADKSSSLYDVPIRKKP